MKLIGGAENGGCAGRRGGSDEALKGAKGAAAGQAQELVAGGLSN